MYLQGWIELTENMYTPFAIPILLAANLHWGDPCYCKDKLGRVDLIFDTCMLIMDRVIISPATVYTCRKLRV